MYQTINNKTMKTTINKRMAKKVAKVLDAALYKSPTTESDIMFKDEGEFTTVIFMTDNAQKILKADPTYDVFSHKVYGDNVLKIDIDNGSVRNFVSWAVSHALSINFN